MENIFKGFKNRLLQSLAKSSPGASSLRVWLHKLRGVTIGKGVWIGYDIIIETSFPSWIKIGNNVVINMRVLFIAHFRGMNKHTKGYSINIEDNVFIGPNVTILPNVTIGEGSVITAGSVITKSIPKKSFVRGNPAEIVATCGIPLTKGTPYEEFMLKLKPVRQ